MQGREPIMKSRRPILILSAIAAIIFTSIALRAAKASPSVTDDQKAVAALDTQYQAAVKVNDAATMDRVLADDFILVTGRGTVHNKTELLKDARDKKSTYEHQ